MSEFRKRTNYKGRERTASGAHLMELLVAITVSALFGLAMTASLSEAMRTTTSTQNQVLAAWMAQEIMERVRASKFSALSGLNGVFEAPLDTDLYFKINSNDPVVVQNFDFLQRPLLLDVDNLKWTAPSSDPLSPAYRFRGDARIKFGIRSDGGRDVFVTISWIENSQDGVAGKRSYNLRGAIHPGGLRI